MDFFERLWHGVIGFSASTVLALFIWVALALIVAAWADVLRKKSWSAVGGFFGIVIVSGMLFTICFYGLRGIYKLSFD